MNGQKHIINRQVLELTIPERGRVQPIQNKTSEIIKYKLQPALDSLFSKLTTADEIVRIDKLVIDLGTISEKELEKVLVERSLKEIGDKISRLKISGITNSGIKPVNGNLVDQNGKFSTTSKSKDLLEQFVYFLQFGRFPWWHKSDKGSAKLGSSTLNENSAKPGSSSLDKSSTKSGSSQLDEIFTEVLKFEIAVLKSSIVPLLSRPSVRKRLVFQFSHSQLDELLKRINEKLFDSFLSMFQVLRLSIKSTQNRNDLTESLYKIALQYFSTEQELMNDELKIGFVKDLLGVFFNKYSTKANENFLIEILQSLEIHQSKKSPENSNLVVVAVVRLALDLNSENQMLQKIIQDNLSKSDAKIKNLVEVHLKIANKESDKKGRALNNDSVKKTDDFVADDFKGVKIKNQDKLFSPFPPKPADDAEGIVVSNAGVVLIHPFLRYFFEGLGLLDKELQFKSQQEVYKAIHLLQYVVSENNTTEETELPLNKILCGLDIAEPVPNSFPLSEEEKEECINLVKTILERWDALKTTNPAALRDTFLLREGILKKSGESWNLTIERNSFDVMLEKLPWSINLIKLPWLSQILYVEW